MPKNNKRSKKTKKIKGKGVADIFKKVSEYANKANEYAKKYRLASRALDIFADVNKYTKEANPVFYNVRDAAYNLGYGKK